MARSGLDGRKVRWLVFCVRRFIAALAEVEHAGEGRKVVGALWSAAIHRRFGRGGTRGGGAKGASGRAFCSAAIHRRSWPRWKTGSGEGAKGVSACAFPSAAIYCPLAQGGNAGRGKELAGALRRGPYQSGKLNSPHRKSDSPVL